VLLLAVLATATAEAGVDVAELEPSEVMVMLSEREHPTGQLAAAMQGARAQVAQMSVDTQKQALDKMRAQAAQSKAELAKNRIELEKLQATAESAAQAFAQAKAPEAAPAGQPASPSVIAAKAAVLENTQEEVAAMKDSVESTAQQVKKAEAGIREAEEQITLQVASAARKAKQDRAAKIIADARERATAALKENSDKAAARKAEIEAKKQKIHSAETKLLNAQTQAAKSEAADQQKLDESQIKAESLAHDYREATTEKKKAMIEEKAAEFTEGLKKQELAVATAIETQAEQAKASATASANQATSTVDRGQMMLTQAAEMLEANKERISAAELQMTAAHAKLESAQHAEEMDKKQIETAQQTIDAMTAETDKLEKKKELVRSFGATLREKADRDADAAKSGLAKAQADYEIAKGQFDRASKEANKLQLKIDHDEINRHKAVQAILTALDNDDSAAAISAGENHEGIDGLIKTAQAAKSRYDIKARTSLDQMKGAKKEEKSALDLQLAANKQYNQATENDKVLANQQAQLDSLYREQGQRKEAAQAKLDAAYSKVKEAEGAYISAKKKFESRLAASRYLKDVKMVVAKKMVNGAEADYGKAEKVEEAEAGAVTNDKSRVQQAQEDLHDATAAAATAKNHAQEATLKVKSLREAQSKAKSDVKTNKRGLEANKRITEAQVRNAQEGLKDARTPDKAVESSKESKSEVERSLVQLKEAKEEDAKAKADAKATQDKAISDMKAIHNEVAKAKGAYKKAFGSN
jgi:hypothetical protein